VTAAAVEKSGDVEVIKTEMGEIRMGVSESELYSKQRAIDSLMASSYN
jgi:hypothetical protein